MTWNETHQRTRIIREIEAAAACDPTGRLPWKESWAPLFGDRDGLLTALRARWDRMCQAQLDSEASDASFRDTHQRLRRTHAGMLRILEANAPSAHASGQAPVRTPSSAAASPA
ncbi:hypothetical protein [Nocardioides rubriscoriae]|uniref:hypothetical protein n=1 Tax=Nocardioides rubriscoriae TaxID=642762 RepID=UPI0011E04F49|nr:hypothetical protein [Nocardioides rubriscoriae]